MVQAKLDPNLYVVDSAILARASTDHQGDTIEHQIMALKEWAKKLSGTRGERFQIRQDHIFSDEGVSGWKASILERPAVKRFIGAVERGEVRCLFIKGISRFNRDDSEAKMFFEWLDGNGVRVLSLEEGFDSQDRGSAMAIFQVHSFLARMESDKKSIAVKIGMKQKVSKGEWKGGIPPYGYRYNPETKRLEPIPEIVPIIQEIFELGAEGRGPGWIAHHFNDSRKWWSVDPKVWTVTQLQRIMVRRAYVGDMISGVCSYKYSRTLEKGRNGNYLFGKKKRILELLPEEEATVVENAHEAIVSRELFQKVQEQMESRKLDKSKPRKPPNARYPLTGLLVCGECGGPMIHHGRNPEKGYQYYSCANKIRKGIGVCQQENVRADMLQDLVILHLEEKLESLRTDDEFWSRFKVSERSTEEFTRRLADIEKELEDQADKLADFILKSKEEAGLPESARDRVVKRISQHIVSLEDEQKRLQQELREATSGNDNLLQVRREVNEVLQHGFHVNPTDTAALRSLFHQWIRKVTLYNDRGPTTTLHRKKKVVIEWKIDTLFSDEEEGSSN